MFRVARLQLSKYLILSLVISLVPTLAGTELAHASGKSPTNINVGFPINWTSYVSNHGATFLESDGRSLNNCGGNIAVGAAACNFLFSYEIGNTLIDSATSPSAFKTWATITGANENSSLCDAGGQGNPLTLYNCFNSNSYGEWFKPLSSGHMNKLSVPLACQNGDGSGTISGIYMNLYEVTKETRASVSIASYNVTSTTTISVTTATNHTFVVGDAVRMSVGAVATMVTITGGVTSTTFTGTSSATLVSGTTASGGSLGSASVEDKISTTPVGSQLVPFTGCDTSWSGKAFGSGDFHTYDFDFGISGGPLVSSTSYYTFLLSGTGVPGVQPAGAAGTGPTISTSTTSINATSGTAITASNAITASGFTGTPTYSISPTLPAGLSFNTSTGVITGTPTVTSSSTTYTITATSGAQTATTTLTIVVGANTSPYITPATQTISVDTATAVSSTAYTPHNFTAGGETYTVSPSLPSGLSINASTGVISGTATNILSATTYTVTAQGHTTPSESATATITITITAPTPPSSSPPAPAPTPVVGIYTTSLNALVTGSSINQNINAVNYSSVSITAGFLPPGLTFNATTGAITGSPTQVGPYSFTVTATGPYGTTSVTYAGNILPPAPVLPVNLPIAFNQGSNVSAALNGSNTTTYALSAGVLPAGLTLNSSTGVISGTPTNPGNYSFTITATGPGGSSSKTYSGIVGKPLPVLPSVLNINLVLGQSFKTLVPKTPGTIFKVTDGKLPEAMTFNPATGEIRGVPRVPGPFSFTLTAKTAGGTISKTYTGVVAPQAVPSSPANTNSGNGTNGGASATGSNTSVESGGNFITAKHKVFFGLDTYWIDPKAAAALQEFVNAIQATIVDGKHPKVEVVGWTQPTRIEPLGPWLSDHRAAAVAKFMRDAGLAGKYTVEGKGRADINRPTSRYVQITVTYPKK